MPTQTTRSALFASAALGALVLMSPSPAGAQAVPPFTSSPCSVSGASPSKTVTCTGNVAAGVRIDNDADTAFTGYTTLKVLDLTQNITGFVSILSPTSATVDVDAGDKKITATGDAIRAAANTGMATVVSNVTNGITATGSGISATSQQSSVSVTSTGNIAAGSGLSSIAIEARGRQTTSSVTVNSTGALSAGNGMSVRGNSVYIRSAGSITATASQGIFADGNNGEVKVFSDGPISAVLHGIRATSNSGDIVVGTTGNIESVRSAGIFTLATGGGDIKITADAGTITSDRAGIYANTNPFGVGNIEISGSVNILAQGQDVPQVRYAANGITAYTGGSADISIDVTGDIESVYARGIYAFSYAGAEIKITTGGDVSGAEQGIFAYSTNNAALTIDSSGGSVTSLQDSAIYARNRGSNTVSVLGSANVYADSATNTAAHGVYAASDFGDVTVDLTGTIESIAARGIYAKSFFGAALVSVKTGGDVTARREAIFAYNPGGEVKVAATAGSVTSSEKSAVVAVGAGNLDVTAGGVITGAAGFAGVEFGDGMLNGSANSLAVLAGGVVKNAGGLADLAIRGESGSETVTNAGTVIGSVNLGAGADSFLNEQTGLFITGNTVVLGDGETLTNAGKLTVGGDAKLFTTAVTGDVTQTADGVFFVDFQPDFNQGQRQSDVMVVSGDANLSGTVLARQWNSTVVNTNQQFVILETTGGVLTDDGLSLVLENETLNPGFTASLEVFGGTQLVLRFSAVGVYWDGGTGAPPDGTVDGGPGTWNTTNENWTISDGLSNNPWPQSGTAIFWGDNGGDVSVVGQQIVDGLTFKTGGYVLQEGANGGLLLNPSGDDAFITVEAGLTAEIATDLSDGPRTVGVVKDGAGRLILSVANDFEGGVLLNQGTLGVGDNQALGAGALTMADGTTLQAAAAGMTLGNTVTVNGVSTVDTQAFTLTLDGEVSGSGTLKKTGSGTLDLMAANDFAGGVNLTDGMLGAGHNTALGMGTLTMAGGTTLRSMAAGLTLGNTVIMNGVSTIDTQAFTLTLDDVVSGTGSLKKIGGGTLNLMAANEFGGGVNLNEGTLGAGSNTALGTGGLAMADTTMLRAMIADLTLGNSIAVSGTGAIDTQAFTMTLAGTVSGTGSLDKTGDGTLILEDGTSLAAWDVRAGTLDNRDVLTASTAMYMSGANTSLLNRAGASVEVNSGNGTLLGGAGTQSIDNAGAMTTAVALGGDNDNYILRATGEQTGAVAGDSGIDFLQIETAAAATRTLTQSSFTGFETVELNREAGSAGTIRLAAASDPASQATLDTGGGAGTSVTLNQGELNLSEAASSVRAEDVIIANGALLSGIGSLFNGAAGLTTNAGTISPGNSSTPGLIPGSGSIGQINVAGPVTQTADGVFFVDFRPDSVAANRSSDVLVLDGKANLKGTVVASQWAGTVVDAEQEFVILETTGGVTAKGLALIIAPTPGYTASLAVVGKDLVLRFTAEQPTPPVTPSEIVPDWAVAAALSALNFSDTLIGCPRSSGAYAAIAEGQCLWMDSGGGYLDANAANGNPGWDQTTWWIGGGGQVALSDEFRLGLGVRYENSNLDQGDDATTSGPLWNAGASLTYTAGPVLLAAAASAGTGSLDSRRDTSSGTAKADHDIGYVHGKLRAGYLFEYGWWYLKPLIDLDATWMTYGDFSEEGGADGAVRAEGEEKAVLSALPRLEIGGDVALDNGVVLRPFLRAGATVFGDTGFDLAWRYAAGPADVAAYEARSELDQVMADVSAGIDVFAANGVSGRIYYDGSFGETIQSHAGGLTARLEF
ncbi:MAG: autotransporter-associated beta strand repeat-containing protein [Aestuariivirga sp.]|uniref:autotransporter-associated beta strand repeat-containing protein n=1 Tax=Aestuariivirga sp. TaxID=2650926 RepID=UPI0038CFF021